MKLLYNWNIQDNGEVVLIKNGCQFMTPIFMLTTLNLLETVAGISRKEILKSGSRAINRNKTKTFTIARPKFLATSQGDVRLLLK